MMKLFKRKEKVPTPQDSINKINSSEDILNKKIVYLSKQRDKQIVIAKNNSKTDKEKAINALKKKKRLEHQMNIHHNTLVNLERQRVALENVYINVDMIKTMKSSKDVMKNVMKEVGGVDSIHDVMDDVSEQVDMCNEIGEAISMIGGNEFDDDELSKEIDDMNDDHELTSTIIGEGLMLPNVPTSEIKSDDDNNKDLEMLSEWAT